MCRLFLRAFKGGKDPSQMASDLQAAVVGGGQGHQNHKEHGFSLVKGKSRHAMEGFHVAEFSIVKDHEVGLFGVFDSYLGDYLRQHLFDNLLNEASFWTDPTKAIGQAYLTTDATILDNAPNLGPGGSTAVTAILIDGKDLLVANVGDSRAVLSKGGVAEQLSIDHEPGQPMERDKIENRGGFVSNIPVPELWGRPPVLEFAMYQVHSEEFKPCLPALEKVEFSEEFRARLLIDDAVHFLEVHYTASHYAAAASHYAAVHYWLCLGAYGTGTIGGVRLPNQGPFKCIMVGDGGTGKSTYVKRKLTGEFEKKYEPTRGKYEHMLDVPTKQGNTRFLCVDTPGHEKPGILRDSYYEGADCAMIICDITAKQTQKDVPMWHDDVRRVRPDIPIVLCGNKVDLKKRQVKTKKVTFHMKKKLQYYEISAKSGYNLDKPFQYLAEKLAGYVEGANCI